MLLGYMRVSTADERQTIDLQQDALLAAGISIENLFQDKASGARDNRPGLKACLAALKPGDSLVVWKLDRLGRSLPHLLTIINDLRDRKIGFRSLTEAMDTNTAQGELLFSLFGALAQYERALIQERVKAGMAAAKRRGKHLGRPAKIPQEVLEQVMAVLNTGASKSSVCRTFGLNRSTLVHTLQRIGWSYQGIGAS